MNAYPTASLPTPTPTTANAPAANPVRGIVVALPTRHVHRERDFGVGYGNSSGYASERRYASNWAPPRFRFA